MIDYSPRAEAVIVAAAWHSERPKGAVGSDKGSQQVEGAVECLGFERRNGSGEVEGLRECAGFHIEDPGVCQQLQPLHTDFNQYDAK